MHRRVRAPTHDGAPLASRAPSFTHTPYVVRPSNYARQAQLPEHTHCPPQPHASHQQLFALQETQEQVVAVALIGEDMAHLIGLLWAMDAIAGKAKPNAVCMAECVWLSDVAPA